MGIGLPTWLRGNTGTTATTPASAAPAQAPEVSRTANTTTSTTASGDAYAGQNKTMRGRLNKFLEEHDGVRTFFRPSAINNKPALRLEGPWTGEPTGKGKARQTDAVPVAEQIAGGWVGSLARRRTENFLPEQHIAIAELKALEYERKNLDTLKKEGKELIWPGMEASEPGKFMSLLEPVMPDLARKMADRKNDKAHKSSYHQEAVVRALLKAAGETDIDTVLESFKEAGTGGLHRHGATMLTAAGNFVNAAQTLSPEPISKAVLTGVRLALILASGQQAFASWDARMANAQTEELMVKGRADAPPSAKVAPDMMEASMGVLKDVWSSKKTLRQIESAVQRVDTARADHQRAIATHTRPDGSISREGKAAITKSEFAVFAAEQNLRMVRAKLCHQINVKSQYKAASESAKVEFLGNKRYFQTTFAGAGLTTGAALFGILTPVLGGVVTGGVSTAAAMGALALYLGYHFSNMPQDDGVRKAMRAIIALAKSSDLFSDQRIAFDMERAAAYADYQSKISRNSSPAKRTQALAELDQKLVDIEKREGDAPPPISAKENWENYRQYLNDVKGLTGEAKAKVDQAYAEKCAAAFDSKIVASGWKDPFSMRLDTGRKLLTGKIAQAHKRLQKLDEAHTVKDFLQLGMKPQEKKNKKEELIAQMQQAMADLLNLDAAENAANEASSLFSEAVDEDSPEAVENVRKLEAALGNVTHYLSAVEDQEFRDIFCGDTKEQVSASKKAKDLTAGEAERYKWTTYGNAAVALSIGGSVAAADFGIAVAKALPPDPVPPAAPGPDGTPPPPQKPPTGQYHGLLFADYKFLGVQALGAPLNGHHNAGARAKIRDVDLQELLSTIQVQAEDVTHTLRWPKSGEFTEDQIKDLVTNLVKEEAANASRDNTFSNELRGLLLMLAKQDNFADRLNLPPKNKFTVAEIKELVTELVTKESFGITFGIPGEQSEKLRAEQIKEFAIEMQRGERIARNLDLPEDGVFTAAQMKPLIEEMVEKKTLPKKLQISYADPAASAPAAGPSTAADTGKKATVIDFEKTSPFWREQVKQAPFSERFRHSKKTSAKVGRQALITLLGIPAQLMAQVSLKHGAPLEDMKTARNEGAAKLKETPQQISDTSPEEMEDFSGGNEESIPMKRMAPLSGGESSRMAQERKTNAAPSIREEAPAPTESGEGSSKAQGKQPMTASTLQKLRSSSSSPKTPEPKTEPRTESAKPEEAAPVETATRSRSSSLVSNLSGFALYGDGDLTYIGKGSGADAKGS